MRQLLTVALLATLVLAVGCDMGSALPEGKVVTSKGVVNELPAATSDVTVDGMLTESTWKDAVAMTDFVRGRADKPTVATRVLATYDKDNLYLAVICDEPNTDALVAKATEHDGNVWSDDSVEFYVEPDGTQSGSYRGLFLNTKNTHYDRGPAESWDPDWTSSVKVIDGKAWVAEAAIPWKALGVTPKPGKKIGIQVARNRRAGEKGEANYLMPCNDEAKDTSAYMLLELH